MTYLLNPAIRGQPRYIREGRCMQKAASWATVWPPITLAQLAAIARNHSEVRLVDGNVEDWTLEGLIEDVRRSKADLVVVSTGFPSIDADMAAAEAIKQAMPTARVVGFGAYFTLLDEKSMEGYPFLDAAIAGEPEETFAELVAAVARGTHNFESIPGLLLHKAGRVISTGPRPLIDDLDTLPFPDRTLLRNDRYRLPHNDRPFTLVNTSRGCPFPCTFCIVKPYYGGRVRRHSLEYILREIQECVARHGLREFLFWEEVFTLDKEFVLQFCQGLRERGLNIAWAATTRATSVEEESLRAMKQAGCYLLGLGIESSSQAILDRAKKQQTVADVQRAVALCRKVGVKTMGHCIFGLPGETPQTAQATIRFMTRLNLDYMQCYCAVPYPKTELGKQARAKGWITARAWSQYDFGGESIMDLDTITGEEVSRFRRQAFRRFYLRPIYLLKAAFGSFSVRRLFTLLKFREWIGRPATKRRDS